VRQAEFALGGLRAALDGPAMPFNSNERLDWWSSRALGGEVHTSWIIHPALGQIRCTVDEGVVMP
jgi:hypothetical protein